MLLKVCVIHGFIESPVLWVIVSGVGVCYNVEAWFWGWGGGRPKGISDGSTTMGLVTLWRHGLGGGRGGRPTGISNGTTTMTRM